MFFVIVENLLNYLIVFVAHFVPPISSELTKKERIERKDRKMLPVFLPAAKPSGHRTVRVVVVVGGGTTLRS